MDQLKRQDEVDPLNWTRAEYEIPSARACGADIGVWKAHLVFKSNPADRFS